MSWHQVWHPQLPLIRPQFWSWRNDICEAFCPWSRLCEEKTITQYEYGWNKNSLKMILLCDINYTVWISSHVLPIAQQLQWNLSTLKRTFSIVKLTVSSKLQRHLTVGYPRHFNQCKCKIYTWEEVELLETWLTSNKFPQSNILLIALHSKITTTTNFIMEMTTAQR